MKRTLISSILITAFAGLGMAQMSGAKKAPASPPAEATVTVAGKVISIKYSAPSMRGRKIFGGKDALQPDNTIWRAGANQATALHTDADLQIKNLSVPKGDYTLYVALNEGKWDLIVSKQTGQWGITRDGTSLDEKQAVGRVAMDMSKPPAPIETYKITLSAGKLELAWENVVASVPFTVK